MPNETGVLTRTLATLEGLETIKLALRDLTFEVSRSQVEPRDRLKGLHKAAEAVGSNRPAKPAACPAEYRQQWLDLRAGRRTRIDLRALRYLCWEADVAMEGAFIHHLSETSPVIRPGSLHGLVSSLHQQWSPNLFKHDIAPARIKRWVCDYTGPNRVLRKWQEAPSMLLDTDGADQFAADMLKHQRSVISQCEEWSVSEQSRYVYAAVCKAVVMAMAHLGSAAANDRYIVDVVLFWSGWDAGDFKTLIDTLLGNPHIEQIPTVASELKKRILQDERLRDPRLPLNLLNWTGISDESRLRFIRWLSADDIEFFFEHVLPRGQDPHGRKAFWLQFVKRVQMSRPLLNDEDLLRLRRTKAFQGNEVGNYGRIEGNPTTSAFLLDFGDLLVIEFSRSGNACYVYDRRNGQEVVNDFWSTATFSSSTYKGLKQKGNALRHISHNGNWQWRLSRLLSRHGIRADEEC